MCLYVCGVSNVVLYAFLKKVFVSVYLCICVKCSPALLPLGISVCLDGVCFVRVYVGAV